MLIEICVVCIYIVLLLGFIASFLVLIIFQNYLISSIMFGIVISLFICICAYSRTIPPYNRVTPIQSFTATSVQKEIKELEGTLVEHPDGSVQVSKINNHIN